MTSLLQAIASGGEPITSGRDNVDIIAAAEAACASIESGQVVPVSVEGI